MEEEAVATLLQRKARRKALLRLQEIQEEERRFDWLRNARPNQLEPSQDWWTIWLILAGRGFGKTRTGAEWIRDLHTKRNIRRSAIIAPTAADARDVCVEGESGIMMICPRGERPLYEPSKRRLTWPSGGTTAVFSADDPERLRGPQFEHSWCDEVAAWQSPQDSWDMMMFGLRLGMHPRCCCTTTPKPIPWLLNLMKREGDDVIIVRGSTYDNLDNLAPTFKREILSKYEGTRLGRQEILGEVLQQIEGAYWNREMFLYEELKSLEKFQRIVIGVDPATSADEKNNKTGIIAAGKEFGDRHSVKAQILADRTTHGTPDFWAKKVVHAFHEFKADRVVAERNQGGEMVRYTIHTIDPNVPVDLIHASRGKTVRAEPVAALYEQGRVSHVPGLDLLEDQMCTYTGGRQKSPDRLDACVHALTSLMLQSKRFEWDLF